MINSRSDWFFDRSKIMNSPYLALIAHLIYLFDGKNHLLIRFFNFWESDN
jgi:hypothetical protein